jgi:hypothetical protein
VSGLSHVDGPASTGRRVETSPPAQQKTVAAHAVPTSAGTGNRKKQRAANAANYSTEQQTLQDH